MEKQTEELVIPNFYNLKNGYGVSTVLQNFAGQKSLLII